MPLLPRFRDVPSVERRLPVRLLVLLAVAALLLTAGGAAAAAGLRLFVVSSPSMGRAAPVGTLVVTAPVRFADLRPGQVIAFHPPGAGGLVVTHRVQAVGPGGLRTRGDLNAAIDAWTLKPQDVVGRADRLLPGLGWLVQAMPLLLAGSLALVLLPGLIRSPPTRSAVRVLGASALVSGLSLQLRPFTGVQLLTTEQRGASTDALVVATGLLPVRVQLRGGGSADLVSGQLGRLRLPPSADGHYAISSQLHLEPLGWAALTLVWLLPMLWVLVVGLPAGRPRTAG